MSNRKNRDRWRIVLIHIRYLLPPFLCLMLVALMLIPNLRYSTASGTQGEVSLLELLDNSWYQVRQNLFGGGDITSLEESFSWLIIALIPILSFLFVSGVVSTFAVAVGALLYVNSREFRRTEGRVWFVTLIPNRVVALILQGLTLPLLFYSRMLIPIYRNVLKIDVLLNVSFPEVWVFGLVFLALTIALSVWSERYEKDMGVDSFKKITSPIVKVVDREGVDETPREPVFKTEAEREYYERQKQVREEQAALIKRLLNKDEKEN